MSEITKLSESTYCNNLYAYSRFRTKVVNIGMTPLGGTYPIRIQSMTNTNTLDTKATVEQAIRMIQAGCEYVRITAPGIKEAKNLKEIKKKLRKNGYDVPLIADIHFNPKAAEVAATIVEKVRINPGNFIDKQLSKKAIYSEKEYGVELKKIKEGISPLIDICKKHGTAIRIGTNHGSLSGRIISRYGDTPLGMVESAMEYIHVFEELNFQNIILSMKASNTRIMVQAYRLLVSRMMKERMNFPLHLGVTEAGEGEDGRIRSAAGIGALLEDGIGDTIRVSLTEEPEKELPVAKTIVDMFINRPQNPEILDNRILYTPYEYNRRVTNSILNIGGSNVTVVIADMSNKREIVPEDLFPIGYEITAPGKQCIRKPNAVDYIYTGKAKFNRLPEDVSILTDAEVFRKFKTRKNLFPLFTKGTFVKSTIRSEVMNFIQAKENELDVEFISLLKKNPTVVLVLTTVDMDLMAVQRKGILSLVEAGCKTAVIVKKNFRYVNKDEFQLAAAIHFGEILIDGLSDGIWITAGKKNLYKTINETSFNILQATRARISKTEYISCPSCGRTMFNIMAATIKIKACTQHLKGLKIAVMGCVVNGPGEMADADYGYVGAGKGKVNLYKGRELIKKGIPEVIAVEALIDLIKEYGDWIEPS
jgi:(E)-4-hydroxy-3-methylbut-2-enyl-diphosphate synthase